jgi:hypothetical protein
MGRPVKTASGNLSTVDISITTNPEAQCLKYVDLSVFAAGSYPEAQTAASELRDQQLVTSIPFVMMEIQELASMLCYCYCCRNCF